MNKLRTVICLGALSLVVSEKPASAHFKLTKPPSWLKEDAVAGGPQKGGPCGPGGIDDVQPIPTSGIVTEFHAGDMVELDWVDTIAHPGHFRIALAENRADFKDPTIKQDATCNYDETMVPMGASGNVLADGVHFRTRVGFNAPAGTMFTYTVTLPNQPCDKCTIQVMQVMENDIQSLSNCHYYHCADIKILPATSGTGSGGTTGAGTGGAEMGGLGMGGLGIAGSTPGGGGGTSVGGTLGTGGDLGGLAGMLASSGGATVVGGTGASGTVSSPSSGGAGTAVTTSGTGGAEETTIPAAGTAGAGGAAEPGSDGGCSVVLRSRGTSAALAAVSLLGLIGLKRRRRDAHAAKGRGKSAGRD